MNGGGTDAASDSGRGRHRQDGAAARQRIAECVRGGGKAVLLVPEQYSFESEKTLYRRLGAKDALSVEVLSFTRLCDRIFREYGGLAGGCTSTRRPRCCS
ncbi:MAG: hypothetical protein ACLVL7_07800 [Anaerotruncus massiliensis (ex Togo et al. 2019)]